MHPPPIMPIIGPPWPGIWAKDGANAVTFSASASAAVAKTLVIVDFLFLLAVPDNEDGRLLPPSGRGVARV